MPLYECVFIVRQDIPSAQVEALATDFAAIVANHGGKVEKTEHWGLRTLAYKIKKNRKGHYVLFNIDGLPSAVTELERNMGINEDILRFLTVRVDELEEGPSAMLRNKGERSERGDKFGGDKFGGDKFDRPRRFSRDDESSEPASF